ncbi:MAG: 23S rRNA (uracil(1939)-C(5))-methyltransferase RlmD [Turicibacter sanguinis]
MTPPCKIYKQCGGCQVQHLNYPGQLQMKYDTVVNQFKRIGHIEDANILPTIGMEEPWRYRNKTQVPFGLANGDVVAGFYQKRSHEIIDMRHCLIQTEISDEIIHEMRGICRDLKLSPYNEESNTGILRHVIVRTGFKTDEIMVILVTRKEKIINMDRIVSRLLEKFPQIKVIAQNINPNVTNAILGEKTNIIYVEGYIYDEMNGIRFAISPRHSIKLTLFKPKHFTLKPLNLQTKEKKSYSMLTVESNDYIILSTTCQKSLWG